jgi:signal transduction histidine kinase
MTIVNEGRLMGVVFLDNFENKEAFTRDDVEKLVAIREHISAAFKKVNTIDHLERQREALREANALKTEFLSIAVHDLKNPLNSINLIAETLQMDWQDASWENIKQSLQMIQRLSTTMFALIKDLLDVNALEQGSRMFEVYPIDMVTIVQSVLESHQLPAQAKSIRLMSELAPEVIVLAEPNGLMQIVDNLLSNAIKFSPFGTCVEIRVSVDSENGRIEIKDEGSGISTADQKKLFGKFARLSAQPTGGEHSTGLGLSIVKKLVEAMNGRVWCESEVGKGATFVVELTQA